MKKRPEKRKVNKFRKPLVIKNMGIMDSNNVEFMEYVWDDVRIHEIWQANNNFLISRIPDEQERTLQMHWRPVANYGKKVVFAQLVQLVQSRALFGHDDRFEKKLDVLFHVKRKWPCLTPPAPTIHDKWLHSSQHWTLFFVNGFWSKGISNNTEGWFWTVESHLYPW